MQLPVVCSEVILGSKICAKEQFHYRHTRSFMQSICREKINKKKIKLGIWDIRNDYCNCPNNETICFYNTVKDADGTANSGDPDQTAPFRSSLI